MEVEDLSDTVADLKRRVEALERELAATRVAAIPIPRGPSTIIDLGELWDNAANGEKRWSEEDFIA